MAEKKITRDKEYIFGYPPVFAPLQPEAIGQGETGAQDMGFYIHVPFCRHICDYCPFNKRPWKEETVTRYVVALLKEIDLLAERTPLQNAHIVAGFMGGGTPSGLAARQIDQLLDYCRRRFNIVTGAEITIEANPGTVDKEKLRALRLAGINRISFGVQSFDDRQLRALGCGHSAKEALDALENAAAAGFDNIGIDLLYGLPGQTLPQWEQQISTALRQGLAHITLPELSIDRGTLLYEKQKAGRMAPVPGEEEAVGMYESAYQRMMEAGYLHYNLPCDFALPGKQSLFHRLSWELPQKEVVGIGAGAYSYFNGAAYFNIADPEQYIARIDEGRLSVHVGKVLTQEEKIARSIIHGVFAGKIDKDLFQRQFNTSMDKLFPRELEHLEQLQWIDNQSHQLLLTPRGRVYVNNVSKTFYAPQYR